MLKKWSVALPGAIALVVATATSGLAHHAFGGEFDPNRPVLLRGKIVKVEWVNPHAWIHVEVPKADGSKQVWMIEGGSPNSLFRRGVTRESLQIGTEIIVDGYQSRDYTQPRANGRNITFVDGKKLFLGSSGTGAPRDGSDPNDKKNPPVQP